MLSTTPLPTSAQCIPKSDCTFERAARDALRLSYTLIIYMVSANLRSSVECKSCLWSASKRGRQVDLQKAKHGRLSVKLLYGIEVILLRRRSPDPHGGEPMLGVAEGFLG